MERVEGKYVYFGRDNLGTVYEADVPKGHLKPFKVFLMLLFNKKIRGLFSETVKYAVMHHDSYRGTGSSEVTLLVGLYSKEFESLFTKE